MTLRPSHQDFRMEYDGRDPIVFMDFSFAGTPPQPIGRIHIQLSPATAPKTAANFFHLCIGSHRDPATGTPQGYLRSPIHHVARGAAILGGDWLRADGSASKSVFIDQPLFADEPSAHAHDRAGVVSMVKTAPDARGAANGSQFLISLAPLSQADGQVVVGRVVQGMDVVRMVGETRTRQGRPERSIVVSACGQM